MAIAFAGTLAAKGVEAGAAEADLTIRPNVLLVLLDDQRADTTAALGHPVVRTPRVDCLVREGTTFAHAYIQGSLQPAVCVPSRASLLSGRNLFRADPFLLRDDTWPAAFARAGYTTFVSGKWHNDPGALVAGFQMTRSVFLGGMADPMQTPLCDRVDGQWTDPRPSGRHACEIFADEAIRFLQEHRDGPFFCFLPLDGPHDPHIVPDEYPVVYDPAQIPLPDNFLDRHPFDNGEMSVRDELLLPTPRPEAAVRAMLADYYRYISYLDLQIGRVLDALAASPFASNTLVVVTSDSGVARGSHGLIGKQNLYEHSIRIPLVMRGPGVTAGATNGALVYLHDVLPTIGARCGVVGPPGGEGRAFDAPAPGRSELIFAYRQVQRAIRDDRWKLIHYPKAGVTQLFDLETDPHELRNLAGDPAQAERVASMRQRLDSRLVEEGGADD